ncbi:MAG: transglutaminase domain-containing protein [Parasporobacterium sp.]|nr:transglutaminase domain-containing protein [Parasporobacterium sp.]
MKKIFIVILFAAVSVIAPFRCAAAAQEAETFVFQPKISSGYMDEIYGETIIEAWYHLIDAVYAGEDTFACPDQYTYDWVMGQLPDRYFPVLTQLIESSYGGAVENGTARFVYTASREEVETKLADFETLVEEILNQNMRTDYSDLEKALSLYRYFYSTYEYDYETFQKQQEAYLPWTSSYRFLMEGTGICSEISTAYSYLLLQAGGDATIVMGDSQFFNYGHQWSYVRINGNNYHVDPTYALGEYGSLEYFLVTDEKRSEEFLPEQFVIAGTYYQEHTHPEYKAEDDTFRILWDTNIEYFDHDMHILYSWKYAEDGTPIAVEFDYGGY